MIKRICVWVWGALIGLIGGCWMHGINIDLEFTELLPSWFVVLEFGVPLIAAAIITYSSDIDVEIADRFWPIVLAYLRIVLVVALTCAAVFALSFCWSLIMYGIVTGELLGSIIFVAIIGGALTGGVTIIIRIFAD